MKFLEKKDGKFVSDFKFILSAIKLLNYYGIYIDETALRNDLITPIKSINLYSVMGDRASKTPSFQKIISLNSISKILNDVSLKTHDLKNATLNIKNNGGNFGELSVTNEILEITDEMSETNVEIVKIALKLSDIDKTIKSNPRRFSIHEFNDIITLSQIGLLYTQSINLSANKIYSLFDESTKKAQEEFKLRNERFIDYASNEHEHFRGF